MKKTFALCLSLALVGVFFLFPVNAASSSSVLNRKTVTYTTNWLDIRVDAVQGYPYSFGTSLTGGYGQSTYLVVSISNRSADNQLLKTTSIKPEYSSSAPVLQINNMGVDLSAVYQDSNGYFRIDPVYPFTGLGSNGFGIIVPGNTVIYAVFEVVTRADFNTSSQTVSGPALSDVQIYCAGSEAYTGEFNGNASDLTGLINAINDSVYSGSHFSYTPEASSRVTVSTTSGSLATADVTRFIGSPYLIELNVDDNTISDTQIVNGSKRYPFIITMNFNVNEPIVVYYQNVISQLFPSNANVFIDYFYSDIYAGIHLDAGTARFTFKHYISDIRRSYLKQTYNKTTVVGYIECGINDSLTFQSPYLGSFFGSIAADPNNTYFPMDEYTILRDLYFQMTNNDQSISDKSDDLADDSDTVAEQIEYVHQQEMAFFEANEDAIEATGLSNFHYNENTISAFTMITNQFASVWNALSDYTLVFIFTLLLSLATFIIRHEPTTKMKQYRTSVAAERAERISYYGRMNAQSRASARNDGDSYFWDAVRRNNM